MTLSNMPLFIEGIFKRLSLLVSLSLKFRIFMFFKLFKAFLIFDLFTVIIKMLLLAVHIFLVSLLVLML